MTINTYFGLVVSLLYYFFCVAVDFDVSMGKGLPCYNQCLQAQKKRSNYTLATHPAPARELLDFFRSLYNKNNLDVVKQAQSVKIPNIIHMIWSGGLFPEIFHAFAQSWRDKHPVWTHILWVDNEINYSFGTHIDYYQGLYQDILSGVYNGRCIVLDIQSLTLYNQHYYDQAKNVGERTDILKYEIIYLFGGVYIDIDFECIKPLDILHYCYDFYIGIQPLDEALSVGLGIFGAHAGHPILKNCIETIQLDRHHKKIIQRTGPIHATRAFWQAAPDSPGVTVALPATFFYPIGLRSYRNIQNKYNYIKPETFALHHWAGSWVER